MNYTIGYKAYNKGLVNRYGQRHEMQKIYTHSGDLVWKTSGFHFCENLEDTLRYYDAMNTPIDICQVVGFGEIREYYDSYYDYEILVSDHLKILKVLTREEILEYAKKLPSHRLCRFIQGMKLSEDEIAYLLSGRNDEDVEKCVRYYQYGEKDVYGRK